VPVYLGGTVADTGGLSGDAGTPSGTLTFTLFGPGDPTCSGTPDFTSTIPVGGFSSTSYTPTAVGTYGWVATYSGDAANNPASSACGLPDETVQVYAVGATTGTPGDVVAYPGVDSASISWTAAPTGTIPTQIYFVTAQPGGATVDSIGTGTTVVFPGLTPGVQYSFTVAGVGGPETRPESPQSAPSNAVVPTSVQPTGSVTGASTGSPAQATATSGSLSAVASGTGSITVAQYASDPVGPFPSGTSYFDVSSQPGSSFTSVTFTDCGLSAGTAIDWWNPASGSFAPVSDESPASASASQPCVTVTIDGAPSPEQLDLSGTIFATTAGAGQGSGLATTGIDLEPLVALGASLIGDGLVLLALRRRRNWAISRSSAR
jgi:hypothetical protein